MSYLLMTLLFLVALFLILIILLQRGRGGGLVGAFGGMGGQSAFGTKAGDLFTRITAITAIIWMLLCIATVKFLSAGSGPINPTLGSEAPPARTEIGADAPAPGDAPGDLGGAAPADTGTAPAAPAAPAGDEANQ